MILKALSFPGYLDVSSPERLGAEEPAIVYRRTVVAGQIFTVPDEYYGFPNIKNAINAGLLQVISYDSAPESLVINAELATFNPGGVPGTKYLFLDFHGAEDTSAVQQVNGTPYLMFNPGATLDATWTITVPDDYIAGTPMFVEAYWSPGTDGAGIVAWGLEYKMTTPGLSVQVDPVFVRYLQASPGVAGTLATTGSNLPVPGGLAQNMLLSLTLGRTGDDPLDTFPGLARVHMARVKYTGKRFA